MSTFKYAEVSAENLPDTSKMKIGFVVTEWNNEITDRLLNSAIETLKRYGLNDDQIIVERVPGSFELIFGAKMMTEWKMTLNAVIAIGCVIRGDTPHFDYICQATTAGITELNVNGDIPVIFGVLTVNNLQQALDRCGGEAGDKGEEFALTAIKMADFNSRIRK